MEFALVLPILAFMLVGILDLSRVFTSILTVESAAREAADYGAYISSNWSTFPNDNRSLTLAGMEQRACIASRNLPDYVGVESHATCDNPSMSVSLVEKNGDPATGCDDPDRAVPCRVKVDLTYTFDVIVPLGIDFHGTRLGLPQDVTFTRTSIFAISDFQVDE